MDIYIYILTELLLIWDWRSKKYFDWGDICNTENPNTYKIWPFIILNIGVNFLIVIIGILKTFSDKCSW